MRLRRPDQARLGLPRDVAAAAPPARPRGLSRRRLLPPLPPAGARRAPQRGQRRRLADRAAGHRDAGQRRVGLHPHQRHLDHRRPDLSSSRTSSTPASGPRSTWASRCRAWARRRRPRPCARSPVRSSWTWRSTASWRRSRSSPRTWTRPRATSSTRGEKISEVIKQPQYQPLAVEQQVAILWVVTNGYLDDVPTARIRDFETQFYRFLETERPDRARDPRRQARSLDDETVAALKDGTAAFKETVHDLGGPRRPAQRAISATPQEAPDRSCRVSARSDAASARSGTSSRSPGPCSSWPPPS